MSEHPFWRAMRNLRSAGLIQREIVRTGRQGPGSVNNDHLTARAVADDKNYRRVERRWFRGAHTVKEIALLLYVCGRGGAHPWQIAKRFDWSLPTVKTHADALISAGYWPTRAPNKRRFMLRPTQKFSGRKNSSRIKRGAKKSRSYIVDLPYTLSVSHVV